MMAKLSELRLSSVATMRSPSKGTFPKKGLAKEHVLIWITRGQGALQINGEERVVIANLLVFIPKGAPYSLDFGANCYGNILRLPEIDQSILPSDHLYFQVRHISEQTKISTSFDLLAKELESNDKFSKFAAEIQANLLLISALRLASATEYFVEKTKQRKIFETFVTLVEKNFKTGNGLSSYAKELGITTQHLTRICQSERGCSGSEFIQDRILAEAKQMLEQTDLRVGDISNRLRFSSAAYFSKLFSQKVGVTPLEFRRVAT